MSKHALFVSGIISLALISGPSFGLPLSEIPDPPRQQEAWPDKTLNENLDISTPPRSTKPPPAPDAHYYSYPQAFTVRAGVASSLSPVNFNDHVLGFQYLFPKFLAPKLEAGVDLHDGGNGHAHAGARWYWFERSYFRPSYKLGADVLIVSEQALATFVRIDNYFVRASAALEYVVWNPWSLRLEYELVANHNTRSMELTLGLSRGW